MRQTLLIAAFATLITAGVEADTASSQMTVSAQVIARAVITVNPGMPAAEITAADIARGYVDWPVAITIQVRTNSRAGYVLAASNQHPTVQRIELALGSDSMRINQETYLARPYVAGGETLTAQARLHLDSTATPGRYDFPLTLTATAR